MDLYSLTYRPTDQVSNILDAPWYREISYPEGQMRK